MEIIKVKANYKNSTLLRIAKKYTIDKLNEDATKINFNEYGACGAIEAVEDMYNLFYYMGCIKGEIKNAKICNNAERIERLRAGKLDYIVSFNHKRLGAVRVVAVV